MVLVSFNPLYRFDSPMSIVLCTAVRFASRELRTARGRSGWTVYVRLVSASRTAFWPELQLVRANVLVPNVVCRLLLS